MSARGEVLEAALYGVPPVVRAFKVLRHVASGDSIRNIAQSARALGISRTTLIRLLATLEAERMLERTRDGAGYQLGLGLAGLAAQALFSADIVEIGDPVLAGLAEQLGLSAHLGVLEGREILYVARRTPNLHLVSNVRIGSRLPAHATSLGRIILANLPVATVQQLFAGVRLKAATAKTPTTLTALLRQIGEDRVEGLAWSSSHFEAGIASVAAAVFDQSGRVVGAVNVTGPSRSFETSGARRQEIGVAITAAADHISKCLGYHAVARAVAALEPVRSSP
jgi:DNA-binding IclR family transcriptional regulator